MNTTDPLREQVVQQRQDEEHLHENVLSRAEAEITTTVADAGLNEQVREQVAQLRQDTEALQEKLLSRAEQQVNPTS
ncbi:hypothetical protein [Pantanalinema sp. GBBB05]|uniref:hypothetical protein n=1 Tax=Pantanalinema sp. GBBB05 TaxID=2604139 RepID=UPI001E12A7C1|nr:hypothetical protein [Pantanalinema sp. GBBB05]